MPFYRGTIHQHSTLWNRNFSNVYLIEESSALEALDVLNAIVTHQAAVTYDTIEFPLNHVINIADKDDARSGFDNGTGALSVTGLGGPLPLFCTCRVVFRSLAGKPEQKYLRLGANEANLTLGQWDGEFVDYVSENYATPLLSQSQYVGPGGEAHVSFVVETAVQNRQLGWHRKTKPGFKRGWVPA